MDILRVSSGMDVLTIGASIPASYPDDPSLIFLASETDVFPAGDLTTMHIQEMETEVNCYWREMPCEDGRTASDETGMGVLGEVLAAGSENKPENLLTCQLARIASCLPIFLTKDNSDIKALCPQGDVRTARIGRPMDAQTYVSTRTSTCTYTRTYKISVRCDHAADLCASPCAAVRGTEGGEEGLKGVKVAVAAATAAAAGGHVLSASHIWFT
ncbi:unnamed protein product [Hydatigera taeniaeformis]|uniref:ZP domain-containing protein n=1 Tax=Hydatigena taeniaeformis TaxID=6205 RepID=A0A0R3WND9_HYDTA|nr:unnamed protein product [Hydatigera taeniaeformis]